MLITTLLFLVLFMLDQLSKYLVEKFLTTGTHTVIPKFLELKLEYNPGMAWGQLGNNTLLLTIISFIAAILLIILATNLNWKRNKVQAISVTLALAGCVGNLFDRLLTVLDVRAGVVDMIIFKPFDWLCELFHLGTTIFNLADAFLVVGVILFAIDFCFFAERKKKKYEDYNRRKI